MARWRAAIAGFALAGASAAPAWGGGLTFDLVSPRGVGRAGASMVSDDGAAAVVVNPGALARRDARRAQLALLVVDDAARFDAVGPGPVVDDRGGATVSPVIGAQGRLGPLVIGAALLDEARLERRLPAPEPGQPVDDVERLFPHRYAGLETLHRRRTIAVGGAWRVAEWLAIGGSVTLSRVELEESRRVWAGFAGRDEVGGAARDIGVRVAGEDGLVPGAAVGVLVAPIDAPVELGASVSIGDRARLSGDATATAATPGEPPQVSLAGARAEATLEAPLVIRTGARWLGERWSVELGGELSVALGDDPVWTVRGVTVVDETGATAPLDRLGSRVAQRTHGAVRGAVDVELVPGLVWATAGWAWASAPTPHDRLTVAAGELGGHTGAFGVEASVDGVTVTLGAARRFVADVDVAFTRIELDNPFDAGSAPTGLGRHEQSRDTVAVTVEVELP